MKTFAIFIPLFTLSAFISVVPYNNDVFENIALLIKDGNSKQLTEYFESTVELTISSREAVYSKTQAEIVVKNFFIKNPPQSFAINHRGSGGEGVKYAIGNLVTSTGNYRTYILLKNKNNRFYIQELRFEQE